MTHIESPNRGHSPKNLLRKVKRNVHRPMTIVAILAIILTYSGILRADEDPQPVPTQTPNILYILVDDLRWDCVGYAGNTVVQTPNIDRLARRGVRFNRFHITSPLCSPSRATILTGLYAHQQSNGVLVNRSWRDIGSDAPTMANVLNDAGYRTVFVGKAHLGGDPRSWGFQETPVWLPNGASNYDNPHLQVNGRWRTLDGNITHAFTDYAIRFLRKRGRGARPFLLTLSTTAPHGPYCCEDEYPYARQAIRDAPPQGLPPGTTLEEYNWPAYYSAIEDLDTQIGRILDELTDLRLRRSTIIFLMSDNGVMAGSHGFRNHKGYWYDESVRVPAILAGPGIPQGESIDFPVMNIDILPTFLNLAGLPIPENLAGKSLLTAIHTGQPTHSHVFGEGGTASESIPTWEMVQSFAGISSGYKYVIETKTGIEHLYNMIADPHELVDLILTPDPPSQVLVELKHLRDQWHLATP